MHPSFEKLKNRIAETIDLSHAAEVLAWDQQTYMPVKGMNVPNKLPLSAALTQSIYRHRSRRLVSRTGTSRFEPDSD